MKDYQRKTAIGDFIVGVPVCDWSTQTAWHDTLNANILAYWEVSRETLEVWEMDRDRWQNYEGTWLDKQTFIGEADNIDTKNKRKGKRQRVSYCSILSGKNAHDRREFLAKEKTTRIDCQITIPTKLHELRRIATYLDLLGSRWGVTHDGYSPATLTLNKRTNEFYARVYIKINESGEYFIRYETELKGGKALQLSNSIGEYGYGKAMALGVNMTLYKSFYIPENMAIDGDLETIKEWNENLEYARFICENSGAALGNIEKEKPKIEDTYNWFIQNVKPAIERIAISGELRADKKINFAKVLKETLEMCNIDNLHDVL